MAFSDVTYLVIGAFALVFLLMTLGYIMDQMSTALTGHIPSSMKTEMDDSWDRNENFFDTSFVAIFLLFGLVSIVLAALVVSHPVILVVWLMFNMVILFIYDTLNDFLTEFMGSIVNTGNMSTATAFIQGDFPKLIVILNMIIPMVLFGKRVLGQ